MAQVAYPMGEMAIRDAILGLTGECDKIPEQQYQDAVLVTAENVGKVIPPDFHGPSGEAMK